MANKRIFLRITSPCNTLSKPLAAKQSDLNLLLIGRALSSHKKSFLDSFHRWGIEIASLRFIGRKRIATKCLR